VGLVSPLLSLGRVEEIEVATECPQN